MKLALVGKKYRFDGGKEKFTDLTLKALATHTEHTLSVIAQTWQEENTFSANINKIICKPRGWGRLAKEYAFTIAAQQLFSQFDLVQSHERIPGCHIYRAGDGVHQEWLAQYSRILPAWKKKLLRHSKFHRYVIAQEQALYNHPAFQAVICISHMVRDEIIQHYNVPINKTHVIYNAINPIYSMKLKSQHQQSIRQHLDIPLTACVIIFVGSAFERKGLLTALNAIAPHKDVYLLVLGKDKHETFYRNEAQQLAPNRVRFCGTQSDPRPFYGAADAFLLPTLYDPLSNACLEAMACGLPIMTSTKCGAKEFIQPGINGFIADALDVTSYQQAIAALRNKSFCMQAGEKAALAVQKLTIENLVKELQILYKESIHTLNSNSRLSAE